jgi:uncharacterized protein YegL
MKKAILPLCAALALSFATSAQSIRLGTGISSHASSGTVQGHQRLGGIEQTGLEVYVLVDYSGSMSDPGKIDAVNRALADFISKLQSDATLMPVVKLGIIGFETSVQVMRQPSLLQPGESAPTFSATGGTNMAGGLAEAYRLIGNSQTSRESKPIVIVMSDGMPDDPHAALQAASQLQGVAHFYALGVTGADVSYLQQLAGTSNASMLSGSKFGNFFGDVRLSLRKHVLSMKNGLGTPRSFSISNTMGWRQ